MHKKLVFFLPEIDYFRIPYNDLKYEDDIEVVDALLDTKNIILRKLYLLHNSTRLNKVISLPFKKIWYKFFYKKGCSSEKIILVFFDAQIRKYDDEYRSFLKGKYPNCTICIILSDLVKTYNIDFRNLQRFADFILTYDPGDANEYGFFYYPNVYSRLPNEMLENCCDSYDLVFCGYLKNRKKIIEKFIKRLEHGTLRSLFIIPDWQEDILFSNTKIINTRVSYIDYLKLLSRAKVILEIDQYGASGYTLRTLEAITYNKKLITTNKAVIDNKLLTSDKVLLLSETESVDLAQWVNRISDNKSELQTVYTVHGLIRFLDNLANCRNDD